MLTGIEVYMFTLMCEMQIKKHKYDHKNNYDYYFDNDGGWKIYQLYKQRNNIVTAYMNCQKQEGK